MKIQRPHIMPSHIVHKSGKAKTVCVTACLTALGVPFDNFQVTGTIAKPNYMSILSRHNLSARSRKSKMPKSLTIGACRKAIKNLDEKAVYMVIVWGSGYCHAMLLDNQGQTIVDTDKRVKDKRKVHSIHAITKMQ